MELNVERFILCCMHACMHACKVGDAQTHEAQVAPQVGLLVSLSLMLRAMPSVALLLADSLLRGGAEYSSPLRLPFLLWTLGQAAK